MRTLEVTLRIQVEPVENSEEYVSVEDGDATDDYSAGEVADIAAYMVSMEDTNDEAFAGSGIFLRFSEATAFNSKWID